MAQSEHGDIKVKGKKDCKAQYLSRYFIEDGECEDLNKKNVFSSVLALIFICL